MKNDRLKFGCQTFTWEMLGPKWKGSTDDLIDAIGKAGYSGIEITDTMIGHYENTPKKFRSRLEELNIQLVSFAFGSDSGFTELSQMDADLDVCKKWVDFAAHFNNALISMGSATIKSAGSRLDKFKISSEIYNKSMQIASDSDVGLAIHPSSHQDTLLYSRADYDQIFSFLDKNVGWVPDTGHILRAKQDIKDVLNTYSNRIRYIHLKDVDKDGAWAMLGQGICDIQEVIKIAENSHNFNGWVVVEEESKLAENDPSAAVHTNFKTLQRMHF